MAAAISTFPDSLTSIYARTVSEVPVSNSEKLPVEGFTGNFANVPIVNNKAADSPIIRPIDKIIPTKIHGIALGKTTLDKV